MGGESDISLANDDEDVMALLVNSRLDIAESLFQQAAYSDAVVAYQAALALAPENEMARAGLKQASLYAANPPTEPAVPAAEPTSVEPQVPDNSHPEEQEVEREPDTNSAPDDAPSADELDVEFHKQGSIGILFEVSSPGALPPGAASDAWQPAAEIFAGVVQAVSEYAPITIGQVKPASQASERTELVRGMALLRVQGESIKGLRFEQALALLSKQQRPLKLTFSREPIPSPPAAFCKEMP